MTTPSSSASDYSRFGQAFISYGSYHYDTVNKTIHIFCVPLILVTLLSMLSYVPYSFTYNDPNLGVITIGAAEVFSLIVVLYYTYLNTLFGVLFGLAALGASIVWKGHFKDYTPAQHFKAIVIIHVVAWILQFIGHGVFEKRKPALMDNIFQTLNAPLFVLMELGQILGITTKEIMAWKAEIKKNVFEYRAKLKKSQE